MTTRTISRTLFALCILVAVTPVLGDSPGGRQQSAGERELVLLNWADYMDPDLVAEFEQKFNARVTEIYFETDELRDEVLVQTEARGYDVVLASGAAMSGYIRRGWVAQLSAKEIPNVKHIDRRWVDERPELAGYAVPYLWGTLGIAYRRDLVGQDITSWKQLLEPAESLRGKIVMVEDSRDVIGMALKALGYSLNSGDPRELAEAERLLMAQRPFVKEYGYIGVTEKSALVTGEAWAAMAYNGDALTLADYHSEIAFAVPEEGTNLWVDYLFVTESSRQKELAAAFINFLNEPKNAARLAMSLNFATPNKAAEPLLSREHRQNPVIYPGEEVLKKSESFSLQYAVCNLRLRNRIFSQVIK